MKLLKFQVAMAPVGHLDGSYENVRELYPYLVERWEALSYEAMSELEDAIGMWEPEKALDFLPEETKDTLLEQLQESYSDGTEFPTFTNPEAYAWLKEAFVAGIEDAELMMTIMWKVS